MCMLTCAFNFHLQLGMRALQASGRQYRVGDFLATAAHLVPDLIEAINQLKAEAVQLHEGQKSVFDSTVSLDDLPDY